MAEGSTDCVSHPSLVKLQSSVFKKAGIVIVSLCNGVPVSRKIVYIVAFNSDIDSICLVVHLFITEYFDEHFHAFYVKPMLLVGVLKLSSLVYPFVLHTHSLSPVSTHKIIALKYALGM